MSNNPQINKLIIAAALATLLASPALAQSYSASYGTGNIVNLSLTRQTDGAAGISATSYNGAGISAKTQSGVSAYAYVPRPNNAFTDAEQALFARQGLSAVPWSVPQAHVR